MSRPCVGRLANTQAVTQVGFVIANDTPQIGTNLIRAAFSGYGR